MRKKYKGYLLAADPSFLTPGRTVVAVMDAMYRELYSGNMACSATEAIKQLKQKINNNEITTLRPVPV